jgi:NAD-dependent deacetylase
MFDPQLINIIKAAKRVVVFTGAGMSAESGIPTFRDAQTGLWEKYDPAKLASAKGYRADKDLVWGWYEWRRMKVMQAQPNAGHYAIAQLAKQIPELTVISQNVDDLHERAGSQSVIHLHGSLFQPRCFACARPYQFATTPLDEPIDGRRLAPPRCENCHGRIRPGVVWFGENLPTDEWRQAETVAKNCDVFFAIGTSGVVMPAAGLPIIASKAGATVIKINPDSMGLETVAKYRLQGKSGDILPLLLDICKNQ